MLKELRARRDVQKKKAAFEAGKLSANIEAKNAAAEHGLAPGQTAVEESYPSTFHNGEPAKSTLLPSKRVLNGSDVADWALVAPRAENGTVSKISN